MKSSLFRYAVFNLAIIVLTGLSVAGESTGAFAKPGDLKYRQVGVVTGSVNGAAAEAAIDMVWVVNFPNLESLMRALRDGGVSAVVLATPVVEAMVAGDPSLAKMEETLRDGDEYAFAVRLDEETLGDRIDAVIRGFREDGTLDKLSSKWIGGESEKKVDATGGGDTLRFGAAVTGAPFVYTGEDGELTGYDIELATLIANELGMKLEIEEMLFAELIPALVNEKVGMIGSSITVSPERAEQVRFSEPYYSSGVAVMVVAK